MDSLLLSLKKCYSDINLFKKTILVKLLDEPQILMNSYYEWNEILNKIQVGRPLEFFRCYFFTSNRKKISIVKIRERIGNIYSNSTPEEIFDSLKNMNNTASIYQAMTLRTFKSRKVNDLLFNLQMIEISAGIPFLLKILLYYKNGSIGEEELIFILKMMEVFHIRCKIIGKRGYYPSKIWSLLTEQISAMSSTSLIFFIQYTLSIEMENNLDNSLFRKRFTQRNYKSEEKFTKYILWRLSEPTGEMVLNVHSIQTEHIMPSKLNNYWREYLEDQTKFPLERIYEEHINNRNKIGNLIIIRDKLNSFLAQKLFTKKKTLYNKSDMKCVKNILKYNNWGFKEIMERTNYLADQAMKTWYIKKPKEVLKENL